MPLPGRKHYNSYLWLVEKSTIQRQVSHKKQNRTVSRLYKSDMRELYASDNFCRFIDGGLNYYSNSIIIYRYKIPTQNFEWSAD